MEGGDQRRISGGNSEGKLEEEAKKGGREGIKEVGGGWTKHK